MNVEKQVLKNLKRAFLAVDPNVMYGVVYYMFHPLPGQVDPLKIYTDANPPNPPPTTPEKKDQAQLDAAIKLGMLICNDEEMLILINKMTNHIMKKLAEDTNASKKRTKNPTKSNADRKASDTVNHEMKRKSKRHRTSKSLQIRHDAKASSSRPPSPGK